MPLVSRLLRFVWLACAAQLWSPAGKAQDFAIDSPRFTALSGPSSDGQFAISGTLGAADDTVLSGGGFALSGAFLSVLPAAAPVGPELIRGGSFENTAGSFIPDGNGVMSLAVGSTAIPGWTTTGAELAWGMNGNAFGPRTPHGTLFLDLTGYHDAPPYGGIAQTIATVPGQAYQLTFSLGADSGRPAYRGPMSVLVSAASAAQSFTSFPFDPGMQWQPFEFYFRAVAAATTLQITGTRSDGGQFLGLDGLSLQPIPSLPLEISSIRLVAGSLELIVPRPLDRFLVEARESLATGQWQVISTVESELPDGAIRLLLPHDPARPKTFFRLRLII